MHSIYRLSSAQFSLHLFAHPDSLLHSFPVGVAPDACCRFAVVARNDASLWSVTRRVAFSVTFVLNTCRAGIGQTPSHSLLTSQRCVEIVPSSKGKETFFLTDISRTNGHRWVAQKCKVRGPRIWFENSFLWHHRCKRHCKSDALRTGCQDIWGGVKITYVDLRSIRAVHLNL
jgi:hypothetical protein